MLFNHSFCLCQNEFPLNSTQVGGRRGGNGKEEPNCISSFVCFPPKKKKKHLSFNNGYFKATLFSSK